MQDQHNMEMLEIFSKHMNYLSQDYDRAAFTQLPRAQTPTDRTVFMLRKQSQQVRQVKIFAQGDLTG